MSTSASKRSTKGLDWPRTYLLEVHSQAITHGLIFIEPISEADAKSLRQRLYRIRRRSDKGNAIFIPPEYHMVTVGQWIPDDGGKLPIIYNRLPNEAPLPHIRPATSDEASVMLPAPDAGTPLPPLEPLNPEAFLANLDNADLTLKPGEVDSFVADLMKSAERRSAKPAKEEPGNE